MRRQHLHFSVLTSILKGESWRMVVRESLLLLSTLKLCPAYIRRLGNWWLIWDLLLFSLFFLFLRSKLGSAWRAVWVLYLFYFGLDPVKKALLMKQVSTLRRLNYPHVLILLIQRREVINTDAAMLFLHDFVFVQLIRDNYEGFLNIFIHSLKHLFSLLP